VAAPKCSSASRNWKQILKAVHHIQASSAETKGGLAGDKPGSNSSQPEINLRCPTKRPARAASDALTARDPMPPLRVSTSKPPSSPSQAPITSKSSSAVAISGFRTAPDAETDTPMTSRPDRTSAVARSLVVAAPVEFESKIEAKIKQSCEQSIIVLCFKRLVPGAYNMGLIGSTSTTAPREVQQSGLSLRMGAASGALGVTAAGSHVNLMEQAKQQWVRGIQRPRGGGGGSAIGDREMRAYNGVDRIVGPDRSCLPRHPPHCRPWCLEFNGIM